MISKTTIFKIKLEDGTYLYLAEYNTNRGWDIQPFIKIIDENQIVEQFLDIFDDDDIKTVKDLKKYLYNKDGVTNDNSILNYYLSELNKIELDDLLFDSDDIYKQTNSDNIGIAFTNNSMIFIDDLEFKYKPKEIINYQKDHKIYPFYLDDELNLSTNINSYKYFDIFEDGDFHSTGIVFKR